MFLLLRACKFFQRGLGQMGLDQVGQDQRSLGQWGIGITSKYLSLTCVKYLRQALYFLTLPWVIRDNTKVRFVRLYSNFGFQSENSLYRAVRHKKVSPLARLFLCLTLQKNGFPIRGDSGGVILSGVIVFLFQIFLRCRVLFGFDILYIYSY